MHKLIEEYFPNDKEKALAFVRAISHGINSEIQRFSTEEYKKFTSSTNNEIKGSSYVLGVSDGADICISLIQDMLDE